MATNSSSLFGICVRQVMHKAVYISLVKSLVKTETTSVLPYSLTSPSTSEKADLFHILPRLTWWALPDSRDTHVQRKQAAPSHVMGREEWGAMAWVRPVAVHWQLWYSVVLRTLWCALCWPPRVRYMVSITDNRTVENVKKNSKKCLTSWKSGVVESGLCSPHAIPASTSVLKRGLSIFLWLKKIQIQ